VQASFRRCSSGAASLSEAVSRIAGSGAEDVISWRRAQLSKYRLIAEDLKKDEEASRATFDTNVARILEGKQCSCSSERSGA
jgi:hypothetical protein